MSWGNIYIIISLFGAGSSLLLVLFSWPYRKTKLMTLFMACTMMSAFMSLGAAGRSISIDNESMALFWDNMIYTGGALLPPIFIFFLFEYYKKSHLLSRKYKIGLCVIPLISFITIWTNDSHHLFMQETAMAVQEGIMVVSERTRGWYYFVHMGYGYTLVLGSIGVILYHHQKAPQQYKYQTLVLITYIVLPLICSVLYTFQIAPLKITLVPFAFFISNLVVAFDLITTQQLGLLPMARRKVLDLIPDGFLIISKQGMILDINDAAKKIIDKTPDAPLKGKLLSDCQGNGPQVFDALRAADGQAELCINIDGRLSYFDTTITPLNNTHDRQEGYIIILRDVSEYKVVQSQLEELNEGLSISNSELDAFAHTVAHDLKSPLNTIRGLLQILEMDCEQYKNAELEMQLKNCGKYASKAVSIISELLLLSQVRRIEDLEFSAFSMSEIVDNCKERLQDDIRQSGRNIRLATLHDTESYAPWVEEIWVNYISNAIKYGGDTHTIDIGSDTTEDGHIRYWVKDQGPGLSTKQQKDLFKDFSRFNNIKEGHGLGLSIVKRIAERLGGTVGVESAPGQGATFYFTLPRVTKKMSREAAHSVY